MTEENREGYDPQIVLRAGRLIEAIMDDDTSHELRVHLVEWFAGAENEREKMQAMETYMYRTLKPEPVPDEFTCRMFKEFMRERAGDTQVGEMESRVPLHRRIWFGFLSGAATAAAVLVIGYGVMSRYADRGGNAGDAASVVPEIPMITVEATDGASREVTLHDNTKVRINSGGKLSWPQRFDYDERRVYLEGEALFDVHGDGHSRFVVQTRTMNIRVMGTKFDVHENMPEKTGTVTLHEGSIEVNIGENVRKLVPGERLVHHHDTDEIAVTLVGDVSAPEKIVF
jgi:ferric-dicitrate binding protein FerR (iron transport regulator)